MMAIVLRGGPCDGQTGTSKLSARWEIFPAPNTGGTFAARYRVTDEVDGEGRRVLVFEAID